MTTAPQRSAAFKRPAYNMLDRALNRLLPPAPRNQCQIVPTKTSLVATWRDVRIVALMLTGTICLALVQVTIYHEMYLSVALILARSLSAIQPVAGDTSFSPTRVVLIIIACIMIVFPYLKRIRKWRWPGWRRLPERCVTTMIVKWQRFRTSHTRRVIVEEQWYREGADQWSQLQRIRSSLAFGIGHISNLIYPFLAFLPLAVMGYVLTSIYRRELRRTDSKDAALIRVIVVHRLYNRCAGVIIGLQLLLFITLIALL